VREIVGFVTFLPKEEFDLRKVVEEVKGEAISEKERNPEGIVTNVLVLVREGKEGVELFYLFLSWGDEREKRETVHLVTQLAKRLGKVKAAVHCCEVWFVEGKDPNALTVRPSLHPERKEGILVAVWQKGKVQAHLARIERKERGVSVGEWELTEQGEEKGLWEPLYRIINAVN
jgi:hypothetical protein